MPGHAAVEWAFSSTLRQAGHAEVQRHTRQFFHSRVVQQAKTWNHLLIWSNCVFEKNAWFKEESSPNKKMKHFRNICSFSKSTNIVFFCISLWSWLCSGPDRWGEASRVEQSIQDCDNWPRCCYRWVPCPLTSKSQRPRFQFHTGLDQISLIAGLRHIFDTFTLEAQLSAD